MSLCMWPTFPPEYLMSAHPHVRVYDVLWCITLTKMCIPKRDAGGCVDEEECSFHWFFGFCKGPPFGNRFVRIHFVQIGSKLTGHT